jgi:hypothetical protein
VPPTTKYKEKTLAKRVDKISLGIDTKFYVVAKAPKGKADISKNRLK